MGRYVLPLLLAASVALSTAACGKPPQAYEKSFFVMDTLVSVQLYAPSFARAQKCFDLVEAKLAELEGVLSAHLPDSDPAKLAASAGRRPQSVQPDTLAVISLSLEYADKSGGAFDITLAPVLKLYSFSPGREARPDPDRLAETLPLVDWQKVRLDPAGSTVSLAEEGMEVDLGGVAKGYIVDRCLEILRQNGIEYGLINAGGDIGFLGAKPDGSSWRVGIKNPDNPGTNFAVVELSRGALATSGDYERFFLEGDLRYHHIIDPRTGLPAREVRSVTILADSSALADLLSTAVFVLGPREGLALIEELPGVDGLIWDAEGQVLWTSGLESRPDQAGVGYYLRRP